MRSPFVYLCIQTVELPIHLCNVMFFDVYIFIVCQLICFSKNNLANVLRGFLLCAPIAMISHKTSTMVCLHSTLFYLDV